MVEQHVANRVVGRMPAGSTDPAAARSAITPVGNKVTLEVLMAKKSTMGSVAVPGWELSLSSSCMARIPKGVAAFPRPRAFEDRFSIMAPMAGCSGGTPGKRRTISGRIRRATSVNMPPASATFMSPRNRVITPIRPRANSTDPPADSTMAFDRISMGESFPSMGTQWS